MVRPGKNSWSISPTEQDLHSPFKQEEEMNEIEII